MENVWNFNSVYGADSNRVRHPLTLGWFLDGEALSDNYTPDDKSAEELFRMWLAKVDTTGDLPIHWWLPDLGELAPFQDAEGHDSFFDFYDWPVHSDDGTRLNWLTLPVQDKHWNRNATDKGGFIQEATGWKPSAFQRTVHLPTLLQASGRR